MMGIVMLKTCWAVSVRQSNRILQLIVASSWVFYLFEWSKVHGTTNPKNYRRFNESTKRNRDYDINSSGEA
jgi:hypothetical protein